MTRFIPGLQLAEDFFHEVVELLLPDDLTYAAALIGSGSEVLGFDDATSSDHDWGPRVVILLDPEDASRRASLRFELAANLPGTFRGYSTHFSAPDMDDGGTQVLQPHVDGPVNHRVEFYSMPRFFERYLGVDIAAEWTNDDWLWMPAQRLRSVTSGRVFRDEIGLSEIRARLAWYPHDVWLYQMASIWQRIGQEEHLLGRADQRGDRLGTMVLTARLIRDVMNLASLIERVYPPYAKWLGTAFAELESAERLEPLLLEASKRPAALSQAFEVLAELHNDLGLTAAQPTRCRGFFGRPFKVIGGSDIATALRDEIDDRALRALPLIGGVDVFSDDTDLLQDPHLLRRADSPEV